MSFLHSEKLTHDMSCDKIYYNDVIGEFLEYQELLSLPDHSLCSVGAQEVIYTIYMKEAYC